MSRWDFPFSPSPDEIIDVLQADYPFGRPARFAFLDDAGQFHVCEASSGEKGPFRGWHPAGSIVGCHSPFRSTTMVATCWK